MHSILDSEIHTHTVYYIKSHLTKQSPMQIVLARNGPHTQVEKCWLVSNKLEIGWLKDDRRLVDCSPLMVQKGDFVDILVVADLKDTVSLQGGLGNIISDIYKHCSSLHTGQQGHNIYVAIKQIAEYW